MMMMMDKENSGLSPNVLRRQSVDQIMEFSPIRDEPLNKEVQKGGGKPASTSTLTCAKFQDTLWIEFGKVDVKSSNFRNFQLKNPQNKTITVAIDKLSDKSGIAITLGSDTTTTPSSVSIKPFEQAQGTVYWSPANDMGMRETVTFKMDDKTPLQMVVHGVAGTGKATDPSKRKGLQVKGTAVQPPKPQHRRSMSSDLSATNSSSSSSVSIKSGKTAKTTNAKSFSTIGHDDKWAEKQVSSFTEWMNFTFAQSAQTPESAALTLSAVDAATITAAEAKSADYANGLKDLLMKRLDAKVRQRGMCLFRSDQVTSVLYSVEKEVDGGYMTLRDDRDVFADLGLQETLFSIIFSYEYPWLRLGLETVFSQIITPYAKGGKKNGRKSGSIPCVTGCSKWKAAFKAFVHENLLADTEIQSRFSAKVLLHVSKEKEMKDLLRQHLLKKMLALILFLDLARTNNVLPMPTLFKKDASGNTASDSGLFKSTKDIIAVFASHFFKGEGDVFRHLALLGFQTSFTQSYIDEFEYPVTNLAVDLRDGVRLARLFSVLAQEASGIVGGEALSTAAQKYGLSKEEQEQLGWDVLSHLRVPAVSRLQKLHNVSLVMQHLARYRGEAPQKDSVEAKNIVDGNRDHTLLFLWKMLYTFQLRNMLLPQKVSDEVAAIHSSDHWRTSIYSTSDAYNLAVSVPTRCANGEIFYPAGTNATDRQQLLAASSSSSSSSAAASKDKEGRDLYTSLLEWCQSIAGKYDVPVYNLTTCMADGRALCLILHYYHPTLLATSMIERTTANLMDTYMSKTSLDLYMESSAQVSQKDTKMALANERKNFATVRRACQDIGGIPLMLPDHDTKNIPEEKTMIVFLAYLFSRLVDSSAEVRAAIRIQRAVRTYLLADFEPFCSETDNDFDDDTASVLTDDVLDAAALLGMMGTASLEEDHVPSSSSSSTAATASKKQQKTHRRKSSLGSRSSSFTLADGFSSFTNGDRDSILNMPVTVAISPTQAAIILQRKMRAWFQRKCFLDHMLLQRTALEQMNKCEKRAAELSAFAKTRALEEEAQLLEQQKREEQEQRAAVLAAEAEEIRLAEEAAEKLRQEDIKAANKAAKALLLVQQQQEQATNDLVAQMQLRLSEEEFCRSAAEKQAKEILAQNEELAKRLKEGEESRSLYIEQLAEELTERTRAEIIAREEMEQNTALQCKLMEAERMQRVIEQREREKAESAKAAADEALRLEQESRRQVELRLEQMAEAARIEKEEEATRIAVLKLKEQEAKAAAEQARLEELEAIRLREEQHAKEAALAKVMYEQERLREQQERDALEKKMQAEIAAREALEARLQAMEQAKRDEEARLRREAEERAALALRQKNACIKMQSVFRCVHYKRQLQSTRTGIIRIQANFRSFLHQQNFVRLRIAVSLLKCCWRRRQCAKLCVARHNAAVAIATAWKMFKTRCAFLTTVSNATIIARWYRSCKQCAAYRHLVQCAVKLQKTVRCKLATQHLQRSRAAILKIQAMYRGHCGRMTAITMARTVRISVLLIQKMWRSFVHLRSERLKSAEMAQKGAIEYSIQQMRNKTATRKISAFIQSSVVYRRTVKCATRISRWYLSYRALLRARKLVRGFTRLCAVRRSRIVRRKCSAKVTAACAKILQAEMRALADPSLKLGKKTAAALEVLRTGKMISHVLKACQTLELSTQLSRYCCEAFAQANAANILFNLLRSCNRSQPHQELLRVTLVVLLHVARHNHLAKSVAEADDAADTLLDLVQMFRDKKPLFVLATELLTRLVNACDNIKAQCNVPVFRKRLDGIMHIMERKHRLEVRVRSAGILSKDQMPATVGCSIKNNSSSPGGGDSNGFDRYRGKQYATVEPIDCMQHLMDLLK